jgi:4a-hydroxytetrahydrobiopterin dehydratase
MITAADLQTQKCVPRHTALTATEIEEYLAAIGSWTLQDGRIVRTFAFRNYHDTLSFINTIAYVIHAEDHHPELVVTYNKCTVKYDTHSVNDGRGGLSQNDFICAAKIDAIFEQSFA